MKNAAPKTQNWSATRQQLASWEKTALLELIKDLYQNAPGNRDFIHARTCNDSDGGAVLKSYKDKIIEQFFPKRGFAKLKLGEARKAIRDYRKASKSIPGTAELLMTYVENGVKFTKEYGDIDERFYSSVESVLGELNTLLHGPARNLYPQYRGRLMELETLTNGIGWGFHDYIAEVAWQLENDLGSAAT